MSNPMSIDRYAQFCAPTTLAGLLGVTRREAAEYLTEKGCNAGGGSTSNWGGILADLGGAKFDPTTPEDDARYYDAVDRYFNRERQTHPKRALRYPTVAEVLRRYPKGVYVLWTTTHTLLARDGEVAVDTRSTSSMRARCHTIYRFRELEGAEDAVGLVAEEAEELDEIHENIRAHKDAQRARRKARREAAERRRQETADWLSIR